MTRRLPFLSIDSRWQARFKWLWSPYASGAETYEGYAAAEVWDSIPFQQVKFDDGILRDYNFAARAQYRPSYGGSGDYYDIFDPCIDAGLPESYCHNCLGLVQDLIAMLDRDGIGAQEISAQHSAETPVRNVRVRDLFFRDFDPANRACTIVYSRAMTHKFAGAGHIADNAEQYFFARSTDSCDGTIGLRSSLAPARFLREFRADAIWFSRSFNELPPVPETAKLVLYIIGAGSVPRIRINGSWLIVSPIYFPSYGNPYGFVFRGHKARITHHGLLPGGMANEIIVEHITPRSECIGAQVIFSMEWTEK